MTLGREGGGFTKKNMSLEKYIFIYKKWLKQQLGGLSKMLTFMLKIKNSRNWFEKKDLDFFSTAFDTEFSGGSF